MNILKSAAIIAVGLVALAGCQKAAVVDTAAVEAETKQSVKDWIAAFNAGDIEAIVTKYAENAVVMAVIGKIIGESRPPIEARTIFFKLERHLFPLLPFE